MIKLVSGKQHNVIKRDGRIEPYQPEKLFKVAYWACRTDTGVSDETAKVMAEELLDGMKLRIYDKIKIRDLYAELIKSAAMKISRLQPIWDTVARNLKLLEIYKETWKLKKTGEYPDLRDVIAKGQKYKVLGYEKEKWDTFTDEELDYLNDIIDPDRDFNFDYLGLNIFMDRYSKKYSKTQHLELPQHAMLRLAVNAFWKEPRDIRMSLISKRYHDLSNFNYSEASPKWLSDQTASCVLASAKDDSWSINHTFSNLGLFSKWGGGLALDVSRLRAKGSTINKAGVSSGSIPFIKIMEAYIKAYDQLGARKGACAVYFNWWDYESPELLLLKEESGVEEERAKQLQYGFKVNDLFLERVLANETVTLFDPKEVPELLESVGEEFNKWYTYYENKPGIRKRKVKAIDLIYTFIDMRVATGNIYIFFDENVNRQTPFNMYVNSSNLCVAGDTKIKISYTLGDRSVIETIKIQELKKYLDTFSNVSVLSFNHSTRVPEYKRITGFYLTNPSARVIKVRDTNTDNYVICTKDHEIFNITQHKYVQAKELTDSDRLLNLTHTQDETFVPGNIDIVELKDPMPVYDITVEDNHNFFANNILIHNCTEVFLPSRGSSLKEESLVYDISNKKYEIIQRIDPGLIALCNLASINLMRWKDLTELEKQEMIYNLLRAEDNLIDNAFYPVKEGELSNKIFRPIGIGETNLAQYFASKGLRFTDDEVLRESFYLEENILYHLITASIKLAKERGPFLEFDNSKWKHGWLPMDAYDELPFDLTYDWDKIRSDIKTYGVRFITLRAIAPTATSGLIIKSTESINPPKQLVSIKTGTYSCKQIVPNIQKYGNVYQTAFEVPNTRLLELAAIRQIFIDQGQSIDTFYKTPDSAAQILEELILARNLGLKSLYYANIRKEDGTITEAEKCVSCEGG